MQVLLHTDLNTDGSQKMAEHLDTVMQDALGRFGERVARVEVHLSNANSLAKTGAGHIHCTLEARLLGLEVVVVKDEARNAHQAIEGAVRKLKRAVGAAVAKHDPRRLRALAEGAAADPAGELEV
jgi:hypothetical protein